MAFDPRSYGAKSGEECPYCGSIYHSDGKFEESIYGYENLIYEPYVCKCEDCGKKFVIYYEYVYEFSEAFSAPYEDAVGVSVNRKSIGRRSRR